MTLPVTGMRYGLHVGFLHGRTPFKRLDKLRKCIHAQPCIYVSLHPVVLPRVDVLRVRLQVRDLYCDPRTEPDVWRTPLGALYLDGPVQVFRHPTVLKVSTRMPWSSLSRYHLRKKAKRSAALATPISVMANRALETRDLRRPVP